MFFIYDTQGLQFRGDIEALKKRRKVESLAKSQGVAIAQDPKEKQKYTKVLQAYTRQNQKDSLEPIVYAYEIMSTPVTSLMEGARLTQAWEIFQEEKIRHLPIINRRGEMMGVLSDRDVLRHLVVGEENRILLDTEKTVEKALRRPAICAHLKSEIRQLAYAMVHQHVGSSPILDDEKRLIGLVTRSDILQGFVSHPRMNLWA